MKYLKLFGILLLLIIGIAAILSLALPVKQTIKRSIDINAPASLVYQQLIRLENFNRWSVWNQQDSTVKHQITGTDGTVGASTSWSGDPEISGEGKIEITVLEENRKLTHSIRFTKPKKANAESVFLLEEKNNITTVSWNFDMATPRPWNIFNLLYSMDKEMGKDFEDGLVTLKKMIEKTAGIVETKTYTVERMNFPATTFAMIRQQIRMEDISTFYEQHLAILYSEAEKVNAVAGTPSVLTYVWDEKNQLADIAVALPVAPGTKMGNNIIQITDIPASKAVYVTYAGAYDKLKDAYASINEYLRLNNLKEKTPTIEQYITGPSSESDSSKWLTKIVFPVE